MTAGIILVLAILVLGGVIAIISDRLGTKVGKARLRIFHLRPRDTAALVTIVSGSILSAFTLAILFSTSKPLRKGVFRIDEIQTKLNQARKEVTKAELETTRIKNELEKARYDLELALTELNQVHATKARIQEKLKQVQAAKAKTEAKLNLTQNQLESIIQQKKKELLGKK